MFDKIIKLLYDIKDRPGVYIGNKSLERLAMFLNGYISCMVEMTNKTTYFLIEIQDYVAQHYNIQFEQHWSEIIKLHTQSEEEAYDKFYELLNEFVKKKKDGSFISPSLNKEDSFKWVNDDTSSSN